MVAMLACYCSVDIAIFVQAFMRSTSEDLEIAGGGERRASVSSTGSASSATSFKRRGSRSIAPRPMRPSQAPRSSIEGGGAHTLKEVLEKLTVQEIAAENWARRPLVLVGAHQTVDKALNRFHDHSISSVPVLDADTGVRSLLHPIIYCPGAAFSIALKQLLVNSPSYLQGVVDIVDVRSTIKHLAATFHEHQTEANVKAAFFKKPICDIIQGSPLLTLLLVIFL